MRTEGQVLILKFTNRLSTIRVARKCGVSQAVVSLWASGRRKPNFENRKALFEVFQIPMEAWDRRVEES